MALAGSRTVRRLCPVFGSSSDHIWLHPPGQSPVIDTKFEPDLSDLGEVRLLAGETGGGFYDQRGIGQAVGKVERLAGHGPDRPAVPLSLYADSLGPYALLAALPFLAWLAGALLPLSAPLKARSRLRPRKGLQRASAAASNQA